MLNLIEKCETKSLSWWACQIELDNVVSCCCINITNRTYEIRTKFFCETRQMINHTTHQHLRHLRFAKSFKNFEEIMKLIFFHIRMSINSLLRSSEFHSTFFFLHLKYHSHRISISTSLLAVKLHSALLS